MSARALCLAFLFALAFPVSAQTSGLPFEVELVEVEIPEMPGLHSFAWAEHDGKWLFVTGRVDGLHPIVTSLEPDVFPAEQANNDVWVVDPATGDVWARPLDELGDTIADPLRATNAQFEQEGETLYVIGGYGVDSSSGEHITFPTLTALDVPGLVDAVTTGGALAPHVRQATDEALAVTGGELHDGMLIGGHRFDGAYTFDGSGFTQTYTERVLYVNIDDENLAVSTSAFFEDPDVLHRRDMTVAPSYRRILPVEAENPDDTIITPSFTLYGGVFRTDADLPFRTQVDFFFSDTPEYAESGYEQQFAHYTAPALPIWDDERETMHTTFFGGMAQFVYDEEDGEVVEDYLVPFTDDIVTLTNNLDADEPATFETVMPTTMPGLLGTNAAFLPAADAPRSPHGVVQLRELGGRTLVGHIVGGIESDSPNPGRIGMAAAETRASGRVFEVYVRRFDVAGEDGAAPTIADLEAPYPNPFRDEATIAFVLDREMDVTVEIFDALGRRVALLHDGPLAGDRRHAFTFRPDDLPSGVYYARVRGAGLVATKPLVRVR